MTTSPNKMPGPSAGRRAPIRAVEAGSQRIRSRRQVTRELDLVFVEHSPPRLPARSGQAAAARETIAAGDLDEARRSLPCRSPTAQQVSKDRPVFASGRLHEPVKLQIEDLAGMQGRGLDVVAGQADGIVQCSVDGVLRRAGGSEPGGRVYTLA